MFAPYSFSCSLQARSKRAVRLAKLRDQRHAEREKARAEGRDVVESSDDEEEGQAEPEVNQNEAMMNQVIDRLRYYS